MGPGGFEPPSPGSRPGVIPSYTKGPCEAGRSAGAWWRHHCPPRVAAIRLLRSQRTRRRIPVFFARNNLTSLECDHDRGRASRTPTARVTAPHAALTPCPAKQTETAKHGERPRSQYAGKPATGRFGFFVALRVMVEVPSRVVVFQSSDGVADCPIPKQLPWRERPPAPWWEFRKGQDPTDMCKMPLGLWFAPEY